MLNSNIYNKVKSFFSLEPEDSEFEYQDFSAPQQPEGRRTEKIVPFSRRGAAMKQSEISVYLPQSFDDARGVADCLKRGKAAVLNLNGVDVDLAKRIVDFISGNIYALEGSTRKIGDNIFIFTPPNFIINMDSGKSSTEERSLGGPDPFVGIQP